MVRLANIMAAAKQRCGLMTGRGWLDSPRIADQAGVALRIDDGAGLVRLKRGGSARASLVAD